MFGADLVPTFTALLLRISAEHEQPALHTATFVGARGGAIVAAIHAVAACLEAVLGLAVDCRDTDFRDLSVVPALLRTSSLLAVVPPSSLYHGLAASALNHITLTLLTFTRPNVDMSKNNLGKSLWSQMVSAVVAHITSSPLHYEPGLALLSSMLPLPSPPDLPPAAATGRKLWAAHLHSLGPAVAGMVGTLAGLGHTGVLATLELVSLQLAGLTPPSARLVVTGVLAALGEQAERREARVEERLMAFLAWCAAQPRLKAVTCELLLEDRAAVVGVMERCLTDPAATPEAQVSCLAAISDLCNPAISLLDGEDRLAMLANSLPDRESISRMMELVVSLFSSDSSMVVMAAGLGVAIMLAGDPFTLHLLQGTLLAAATRPCLVTLLRRLAVEVGVERPEVAACLSSCLRLLALLRAPLAGALALVAGWTCLEEGEEEAAERRRTHPLTVLANRLREEQGEVAVEEVAIITVSCFHTQNSFIWDSQTWKDSPFRHQELLASLEGSTDAPGCLAAALAQEGEEVAAPSPLLARWGGATDQQGGLSLSDWVAGGDTGDTFFCPSQYSNLLPCRAVGPWPGGAGPAHGGPAGRGRQVPGRRRPRRRGQGRHQGDHPCHRKEEEGREEVADGDKDIAQQEYHLELQGGRQRVHPGTRLRALVLPA